MSSPQTTASDLAAVAEAIREHDRFTITTHENPDGDALGSLLAAKLGLDQLGKDSVMVLHGDAPLPGEYAFMPLAALQRRWPDDVSERVLLAVDCANESRIADPEVLGRVPLPTPDAYLADATQSVAVGAGSVWVGQGTANPSYVWRLDPVSGRVVRRYVIPEGGLCPVPGVRSPAGVLLGIN